MDSIRALLQDTSMAPSVVGTTVSVVFVWFDNIKLLLWGLLPATLQILWLVCAFWFAFTWLPERLN